MKRYFALLLALGMLLSLFAGCGKAEDSGRESPKDDEVEVEKQDCEHSFAEDGWTVKKESTCEKAGYEERECSLCGEKEKRELPLGEHSYENGACTVCGEKSKGSEGLQFTSDYSKSTYTWNAYYLGMGECTDTVVTVPAEVYDNGVEQTIPVTGIATFASFGSDVTDITFLSAISDMPEYFFCDYPSLQRVAFAEGQTRIPEGTFAGNAGIREVKLPTTIESIGRHAFSGTSLESVVIPGGVRVVDEKTFYDCKALKELTLSEGVTQIRERAFESCTALERISIPATVERFEGWAFYGCESLRELDLRCAATGIPSLMCAGAKSLTSVIMGDQMTAIGQAAFQNCAALESITLSASLKTICKSAFSGCSALTRLELPESLTKIETGAFDYADALTELVYAGTVEQWEQIELESGWLGDSPATVVRCADGEVELA